MMSILVRALFKLRFPPDALSLDTLGNEIGTQSQIRNGRQKEEGVYLRLAVFF
jgi:hypothetical protein